MIEQYCTQVATNHNDLFAAVLELQALPLDLRATGGGRHQLWAHFLRAPCSMLTSRMPTQSSRKEHFNWPGHCWALITGDFWNKRFWLESRPSLELLTAREPFWASADSVFFFFYYYFKGELHYFLAGIWIHSTSFQIFVYFPSEPQHISESLSIHQLNPLLHFFLFLHRQHPWKETKK